MIEQEEKKTKKQWAKPDFYLIDSDNVRGGANNGIHERNVVSSTPGANVGKSTRPFVLYYAGGTFRYGANTKNAYYS